MDNLWVVVMPHCTIFSVDIILILQSSYSHFEPPYTFSLIHFTCFVTWSMLTWEKVNIEFNMALTLCVAISANIWTLSSSTPLDTPPGMTPPTTAPDLTNNLCGVGQWYSVTSLVSVHGWLYTTTSHTWNQSKFNWNEYGRLIADIHKHSKIIEFS